jgi:hypothetical protein
LNNYVFVFLAYKNDRDEQKVRVAYKGRVQDTDTQNMDTDSPANTDKKSIESEDILQIANVEDDKKNT